MFKIGDRIIMREDAKEDFKRRFPDIFDYWSSGVFVVFKSVVSELGACRDPSQKFTRWISADPLWFELEIMFDYEYVDGF